MIQIKNTERGLHDYGDPVVCTYGNEARIRESSAAAGPHVWIFAKSGPYLEPKPGDVALHLNVEQARALIERLQYWLDEIPSRWEGGEKWL